VQRPKLAGGVPPAACQFAELKQLTRIGIGWLRRGAYCGHRRGNLTSGSEVLVSRYFLLLHKLTANKLNGDTAVLCAPLSSSVIGHGLGFAKTFGLDGVRRDSLLN
jgi:hypothetical protein